MALYAQTSGTHQTNSATWTAIPGLTLTIPEGVGASALIILNAPMPYATGHSNPGGNFGVAVGGKVSPVVACFTYNEVQPASYGRIPTTLVLSVPLGPKPQTITAMWSNVRGSTVIIDSPATLSAVLT
jgi:mannose-binding lectin